MGRPARRLGPTAAIVVTALLMLGACSTGSDPDAGPADEAGGDVASTDPATPTTTDEGAGITDGGGTTDDEPPDPDLDGGSDDGGAPTTGPDVSTVGASGLPDGLGPVVERAEAAADAAEASVTTPADDPGRDGEVLEARRDAAAEVLVDADYRLIRPRSPVGVTIVPDRDDGGCDRPAVTALYDRPPAADVLGTVAPAAGDDLDAYFDGLRAGWLIDRADVIAYPIDGAPVTGPGLAGGGRAETLAAGSPVLVDGDGIIRVSCVDGRPVGPRWWPLDGRVVPVRIFADTVIAASISAEVPTEPTETLDGTFTDDPSAAIGPPDDVAVSLGDGPGDDPSTCELAVTVSFVDNALVDGPGDDLHVTELGRSESMLVSVGTGPDDLRFVGEISGDRPSIDLGVVASSGDRFSVVELCDGPDASSDVPGPDIDAVAALNSVDVGR